MELEYSTVISPKDHMWITGKQCYFDVGRSALDCIKSALTTTHVAPTSILDLPCGHGRVCRMLRALFPDAHLAACDLDRDAVDFCAAQLAFVCRQLERCGVLHSVAKTVGKSGCTRKGPDKITIRTPGSAIVRLVRRTLMTV